MAKCKASTGSAVKLVNIFSVLGFSRDCLPCSISEESDTNAEWHVEGRRLVPSLNRHISHSGHTLSTRNLSRPERPANLRSAAAATAAAPARTKQGILHRLI